MHFEQGSAADVDESLTSAEHVVSVKLVNNRVVPSPLEPRATLVEPTEDGFTLYNPSQGAWVSVLFWHMCFPCHPPRSGWFRQIPVAALRARRVHSEVCVAAFAAMALGRPIKYTGDRSEMFLSDNHGRDNLTQVTGSFDAQGNILLFE